MPDNPFQSDPMPPEYTPDDAGMWDAWQRRMLGNAGIAAGTAGALGGAAIAAAPAIMGGPATTMAAIPLSFIGAAPGAALGRYSDIETDRARMDWEKARLGNNPDAYAYTHEYEAPFKSMYDKRNPG